MNRQIQKYQRFNSLLLLSSLTPLLSIGLFNIAIDPYGLFASPTFTNINRTKPEKFTHDMLFKAIKITRIKPNIIFLGSSRVQWGLEPLHPGLPNNETPYNLGLQGANMYAVKRYFDHALANQPKVKQVILGIDFLMFSDSIKNTPAFTEDRLEKKFITLQELLDVTFSLDAFESSRETITANLNNTEDNLTIGSGNITVRGNIFDRGILTVDDRYPFPKSKQNFSRGMARSIRYSGSHQLSKERLLQLKSMIDTCQQRGIDIKVFISPSHATDMESIHMQGLWSEFENWKREVIKITPVWDFSGYNSITTEPIAKNMKYYLDSSHYRKEAGALILNRLLSYQENTVPNDFGVLVTSDNIEFHLAKIRSDRQKWISKSPDGSLVQELKNEQTKS